MNGFWIVFLIRKAQELISTSLNFYMFYTVRDEVTDQYQDRGSRFIGVLFRSDDHHSFEIKLSDIREKYPDATHHCYACRFGTELVDELASDAGEPSGTAGLPILNRLRSYEVTNCGLAVIRYFGGTKLGKSGLIQAYGTTAQLCMEKSRLTELIPSVTIEVIYPYDQSRHIKQWIQKWEAVGKDSQYLEKVTEVMALPSANKDAAVGELKRLEYLGVQLQIKSEGWITKGIKP